MAIEQLNEIATFHNVLECHADFTDCQEWSRLQQGWSLFRGFCFRVIQAAGNNGDYFPVVSVWLTTHVWDLKVSLMAAVVSIHVQPVNER